MFHGLSSVTFFQHFFSWSLNIILPSCSIKKKTKINSIDQLIDLIIMIWFRFSGYIVVAGWCRPFNCWCLKWIKIYFFLFFFALVFQFKWLCSCFFSFVFYYPTFLSFFPLYARSIHLTVCHSYMYAGCSAMFFLIIKSTSSVRRIRRRRRRSAL